MDKNVVVCMPWDARMVESEKRECRDCKATLALSAVTKKAAGPDCDVVCIECFSKEVSTMVENGEDVLIAMPTPDELKAVREGLAARSKETLH